MSHAIGRAKEKIIIVTFILLYLSYQECDTYIMELKKRPSPRKKKSFTISETAYKILIDASKSNDISVSEALTQIVEQAEKKAKPKK